MYLQRKVILKMCTVHISKISLIGFEAYKLVLQGPLFLNHTLLETSMQRLDLFKRRRFICVSAVPGQVNVSAESCARLYKGS